MTILDNAAPTPSPAGHDAAMAAAFDATQVQAATSATAASSETPPTERPAWLPEGVNTPEELAAAYEALKAGKQETPKITPEAAAAATAAEAAAAASSAGIDFPALEAEFASNGALKPETYAALEAKGFNKATVDGYIAGQTALADRIQTEIYGTVGGLEGYSAMTSWASQNLSQAEIEAFDNAVTNGSVETIKLAVHGLNARYRDAEGSAPTNLLGGHGGSAQTDVYRSTAELTAAMSDPRYAKDPAYRADVEAKLHRSSIL